MLPRRMSNQRQPWWLWPNLLSLDAPLVAVAWLYMFVRTWHVNYLYWETYLVLGLGVWVIYVLDRLIDQKMGAGHDPALGARHAFHEKYRAFFITGIFTAILISVWCLFFKLPAEIILSYAIPGIVLVVSFFVIVITSERNAQIPYFRNLIAGLAFGYGTAMMAHASMPMEGVWHLMLSREMVAFAVLCMINITAIHTWEHSRLSDDPDTQAADEMSLTIPLVILAGVAMLFAYKDNPGMFTSEELSGTSKPRPFFYAILISSALLYMLNRSQRRFSMDTLRFLADAALVAPLPLFFILSQS